MGFLVIMGRVFHRLFFRIIRNSTSHPNDPLRNCLVQNLLNWRSAIECLIRLIVVVVVSEAPELLTGVGWTAPPEGVKVVNSH